MPRRLTRHFTRRNASRLLRVSVQLALVAAAIVWALNAFMLPWLVRNRAAEALARLGVSNASFQVHRATLWDTRLGALAAGSESGPRVGGIDIRYRPLAAAGGRLDAISVHGAQLHLTIRDGKVRIAGIADAPAGGASAGDADLPFGRLDVATSVLHVDWEGRQYQLPVAGSLVNQGPVGVSLKLQSFLYGTPVAISGMIGPGGEALNLTASAEDLNLAGLLAALPSSVWNGPVRAGGRVGLSARYRRAGGESSTAVTLRPRDVWASVESPVGALALDGATLTVSAEWGEGSGLQRLTADGTIGQLTVSGQTLRYIHVKADTAGPAVTFAASARADTWKLGDLRGEVDGLLRDRAASETGGYAVRAAWSADGRLPGWALAKLAEAGASLRRPGPIATTGQAVVTLRPTETGAFDWRADVPEATLQFGDSDWSFPGGANVRGAGGVLSVAGTFAPDGLNARLRHGSWIGMAGLDVGTTRVGSARLDLAPVGERSLARWTPAAAGGTRASFDTAARASSTAAVSFDAPGASASVGPVSISARAESSGGAKPTYRAEVAWTGGAVRSTGWALGNVSARVPLAWNVPPESVKAGELTAGLVTLGQERLPPLTGAIRATDGAVGFATQWPFVENGTLYAQGWLRPGAGGLDGELSASVPKFMLGDPQRLARLVPAFRGYDLTGGIEAAASLKLNAGRVVPLVTVRADGLALRAPPEQGVAIEGMTGQVTFNRLSPLATPGGQSFKVAKAAVGSFEFSNASLRFTVERPDSVLVEKVDARWAGGDVYTDAFRFNPAKPDVVLTTYADRLSVARVLDVFAAGKVQGEGLLFGRVPVAIKWPKVTFGTGYLYSVPGTGGELKVADARLVQDVLEKSDPRFTADQALSSVKDRVVEALKDFRYDAFRIDLVNEPNEALLIRLQTTGRGRVGARPQELDLTFNLRGAEEGLNAYLRGKRQFDRLTGQ